MMYLTINKRLFNTRVFHIPTFSKIIMLTCVFFVFSVIFFHIAVCTWLVAAYARLEYSGKINKKLLNHEYLVLSDSCQSV